MVKQRMKNLESACHPMNSVAVRWQRAQEQKQQQQHGHLPKVVKQIDSLVNALNTR
jgi:uncharacterized FlaG/YvyC family protein